MNIIFSVVLFPLIGFLLLAFSQGSLSKRYAEIIGIFSVLISFIITILYKISFIVNPAQVFVQKLLTWLSLNGLIINFGFFLDELSLSMLGVVTGVGLLIHIFSCWYIGFEEAYSRFFAYTNLFISSMSLLVLADNFLFMYLGWEGVSICSYLLIGFYNTYPKNNWRALKAFLITRISDVFLIISMFLIYKKYGTLNFQDIKLISMFISTGNFYDINFINFFLLMGVLGKSAQLPLQTWLSDAMVGPTPVSALIHAATMVTAGIYLIARTHFLFLLTPNILFLMSFIGILTVLMSSFSALVQTNIKRILAYSTMSQIGYMFVGLGAKAWSAVIIHLIMHAIFKALLFLSAGSLIKSCNNEKNIFKMGGLRKKLPFLYISFLISGASLSSFPLLTSGFYSKGDILFSVLENGFVNFFIIGLFCSFLTSVYTFRMIFVIFHGNSSIHKVFSSTKLSHNAPLLVLLILSTIIGCYISPSLLYVFPKHDVIMNKKWMFEILSSILSISGIYFSYYFWIKNPSFMNRIIKFKFIELISFFWLKGWGFDRLYNLLFTKLYFYISKILSLDPCNKIVFFFINITRFINTTLLKSSNGYIKWYIQSMIIGINLFFLLMIFFCFF